MKVTVLDDYFDTLRTLPSFGRLEGHDVTVYDDHLDDVAQLAERLRDTEVLVLFRERTAIRAELLERLPALRLISQRSVFPHIDVPACTRLGIVVSSDLHAGTPSYAAAELTWALLLAAVRDLPRQQASLRSGQWQSGVGETLRGTTLGILGYGRIGAVVANYATAFGMPVVVWGGDGSRRRAALDGRRVAARSARAVRGVRRGVAAPATGAGDQGHRDVGRPLSHGRAGDSGQHQPRRPDRARRSGHRPAARSPGTGRG